MNKEKDLISLIEQFNQATLEKSDWTHAAHLTVAIWHIKQYAFADAVCRLRSKIILLNNFHDTPNTMNSGYHETLTVFWAKIIYFYILSHPDDSFEKLVTEFLKSDLANKEIAYRFYKKENLLSADFRAIYHEPTLSKLDLTNPLFGE